MRFAFAPLHLALVAAASISLATNVLAETKQLGDVVVTANRAETDAEQLTTTVSVHEREALERRLPGDLADALSAEADLAWARDLRRFGATRPNVRGLEDNRVLQLLDGIRIGDYYNGGGPTNFTSNAPLSAMTDFIRRVEVVRGPGSSLYGSDAMGGVLGTITLDPQDLLRDGRATGLRATGTYRQAGQSARASVLGAWRGATVEALLGYAQQSGQETENFGTLDVTGPARSAPNPQRTDDRGLLAKLQAQPAPGHRLLVSLEGREAEASTEVKRIASSLPRISLMSGDDAANRLRLSADWEHKPATPQYYDRLLARVYAQESKTHNQNRQRRSGTSASCSAVSPGANQCFIDQDFRFDQEAQGAHLQAERQWRGESVAHLLTLGMDIDQSRVEEWRDARILNETTGARLTSLAGETFPLRDFANGRSTTVGVFLQDEVLGLAGGRLSLTPGLRYDWRRLKPEVDDLARPVLTALQREAVEQSDGALSPKLGALFSLNPGASLYGQIARAFRAPNYREVNGSFRNPVQSYGVSPNPDLKPETGISAELGLRIKSETWRAQFAAYDNRYRDFIETVRLSCPSDPRCLSGLANTSMAVNLARVSIRGAEARASWSFLPAWRIEGMVAYTRGSESDSGAPLNSIEPARAGLGLAYASSAWGAEARARGAQRKTRVDERDGVWFKPPGYGVLDLSVWWQARPGLRVSAALNNVFDRKYWLWSDIRQADASSPQGVDFYTQARRNLSLSIQAEF